MGLHRIADESKLVIFERKSLRRIFGPEKNEDRDYGKRSNRELNTLFDEPNIVDILKSQTVKLTVAYREQGTKSYEQ